MAVEVSREETTRLSLSGRYWMVFRWIQSCSPACQKKGVGGADGPGLAVVVRHQVLEVQQQIHLAAGQVHFHHQVFHIHRTGLLHPEPPPCRPGHS